MDKIKIKASMKQVERDLKYYMENYDMSQKEAYEEIYRNYYFRMLIAGNYVEVEAKSKIHGEGNIFKGDKNV